MELNFDVGSEQNVSTDQTPMTEKEEFSAEEELSTVEIPETIPELPAVETASLDSFFDEPETGIPDNEFPSDDAEEEHIVLSSELPEFEIEPEQEAASEEKPFAEPVDKNVSAEASVSQEKDSRKAAAKKPAAKKHGKTALELRQDADWFNLMNGKHLLLKTFLLAMVTSIVMFLPSIIYDNGYFLFLGDFNAQQVPFYLVAHRAVHSGFLGWDWYTDLGANVIGSYSFYLLGSPFFWLSVPFPESAVPYLMGPLLVLKYSFMAMLAAAWLRRYVKNPAWAVVGGLMYAFSGYTMYNTFFNHFLDVMVFFPLMTIAMDELVENNRRGVFALAVALNAIVNYLFFAGEAVFMILYYVVKVWLGGYKTSIKRFFVVGFEAVIGFAMSAFIVWPSLLVMIANPRSSGMLNGYGFWIFDSERRYWVILMNMFFPPELPSQPIMITDSYMRWSSCTLYLPIVSMGGVIAYVRSHKRNWVKNLLILSFIMALIPGLNSFFSALNSSYYARWYFMLTLVMVLATVMAFDQGDEEALRGGIKIMAVFTIIAILALTLTPKVTNVKKEVEITKEVDSSIVTKTEKVDVEEVSLGVYAKDQMIPWAFMGGTAIVSIFALYRMMRYRKMKPKLFLSYMTFAVCLFGMIYGNYYLIYGKTRSFDTKNYLIPDAIHGREQVEDVLSPAPGDFYRTDNDDSFINIGMYWNVPDMHAFHSLVPASIMDYYIYIGDKRDVNSKMEYKRFASRSLFSMKYFCDRIDYTSDVFGDKEDPEADTKMPGYTYQYDVAGYAVWENDYFIPMGFTYDSYILRSEADDVATVNRDKMMLKALILSDEQAEKYGDLLEHTTTKSFRYAEDAYFADCEARRQETASEFYYDSHGFSAKITLEKENLVFFSVPYEENAWTATVNGKEVEVENVQIGFIAVKADAGENDIVVTYHTPGLSIGLKLSAASAVLLVLYWIGAEIMKAVLKRRAVRKSA